MKVEAPELRALMTILRSTGPCRGGGKVAGPRRCVLHVFVTTRRVQLGCDKTSIASSIRTQRCLARRGAVGTGEGRAGCQMAGHALEGGWAGQALLTWHLILTHQPIAVQALPDASVAYHYL